MHFYYDAQNRPSIVNYNGNHYAYVYNLQGDVMALLDNTGTKVVSYSYNAWGKLLNTTGSMAATLGVLNPFRYRGYIYDEETGFYYLRSRYYYPNRCRFINADKLITNNTFAYCNNNSIFAIDANGKSEIPAVELNGNYSLEFVKNGFQVFNDYTLNDIAAVSDTFEVGDPVYVLNSPTGYVGSKYVKAYQHLSEGGGVWIEGWIASSHSDPLLANALFNKGYVNQGNESSILNLQCALNQLANDPKEGGINYDGSLAVIGCDGKYGDETINAVTSFQYYIQAKYDSSFVADGIAGKKTCKYIAFELLRHDPKYKSVPFQKVTLDNYRMR